MASRKAKRRKEARRTVKLLTLSEVAKRAGVCIPTAQNYKRKYQKRLPSVGSGRKQRYKATAVGVFQRLKQENVQRRGRRSGTPAVSSKSKGSTRNGGRRRGALSLAEIARRTKIAYPTLLRYLKIHTRKIPSIGSGRARRFPTRAVKVFERLRRQSRGGRPRAGAGPSARVAAGVDRELAARIQRIESMQAKVAGQLAEVVRVLKQPLQVTIRPE